MDITACSCAPSEDSPTCGAAGSWCGEFIDWYNDEHHHSGLNGHIPADVFHRRDSAVTAIKQAALDVAYRDHPERFVHGTPKAKAPPIMVEINPWPTPIISLTSATRSHEVNAEEKLKSTEI
ncbi:MAG: hypothetical protein AB7E72_08145 [Lysobacterales bacterium]